MLTKEQIGEFQTELGLRFSDMMGGSPPNVEQMVELIKVEKAARSLISEINGIVSHVPFEDYEAATAIVEASEPKNPFDLADDPWEHPEDFDWIHNDDRTVTSRPKREMNEIG